MANFSYSKLDTFEQCGFKYYLRYEEGHYIFNSSIATEIGTLTHATEEAIAKSIIAKEPIDYVKLKNNYIKTLYELKNKYPADYWAADKSNRDYEVKTYEYLRTGIYKLEQFMLDHPSYEIVGVEQAFTVNFNGYTLKGYIDRVFHDTATNTYLIQDIKTWAQPEDDKKLATPLQFVIYTMAAKELYQCTEQQVLCQYYLPFCNTVQNVHSGYFNRGTTKLSKVFASIAAKEFEPKASPLCNWCEFSCTNPDASHEGKYLCPYHSRWERETRNKADIAKTEFKWEGLMMHPIIMEKYNAKLNNTQNL